MNVTRAIRAALRRIDEHEPELGRLLQRTIRTGTSCVYRPDPDAPLRWEVARLTARLCGCQCDGGRNSVIL